MGEIADRIQKEILSWQGVSVREHRFGGVEFRVNGKEMGHLHGDRMADLPFPANTRDRLVESGMASPHHFIPQSGWVSYHIEGTPDIPNVVGLFRMQYERMAQKGSVSQGA
jgi:Family of unknown function (DUF5519)